MATDAQPQAYQESTGRGKNNDKPEAVAPSGGESQPSNYSAVLWKCGSSVAGSDFSRDAGMS